MRGKGCSFVNWVYMHDISSIEKGTMVLNDNYIYKPTVKLWLPSWIIIIIIIRLKLINNNNMCPASTISFSGEQSFSPFSPLVFSEEGVMSGFYFRCASPPRRLNIKAISFLGLLLFTSLSKFAKRSGMPSMAVVTF